MTFMYARHTNQYCVYRCSHSKYVYSIYSPESSTAVFLLITLIAYAVVYQDSSEPHANLSSLQFQVLTKPPLTISPSIIWSSAWVFSPEQLKYVHGDKHRPGKRPNHDQNSTPVWHRPVCNDKTAMPTDTRWYNTVPVGMRVGIRQRWSCEGRIRRRDLNGGIVGTSEDRG